MSVPFRKREQHQQDTTWIYQTNKKSSNEIFFGEETQFRSQINVGIKYLLLNFLSKITSLASAKPAYVLPIWNVQDIEVLKIHSTLLAYNFNQLLIKVIFGIQSNVHVSQFSF